MPELRSRWEALLRRLGVTKGAAEVWEELAAAYASPERHYHHLGHLADCFAQLDDSGEAPKEAIELAIWFHDVIYDSHASDNEARSAEFAHVKLRELGLGKDLITEVESLILVTKTHQAHTAAEELLVSVDLSILGRDRATYEAYAAAIRREYDWVPEEAYREGRSRVLRSFLSRPVIFPHPRFRNRYENPARENLAWELGILEVG